MHTIKVQISMYIYAVWSSFFFILLQDHSVRKNIHKTREGPDQTDLNVQADLSILALFFTLQFMFIAPVNP